MSVVSTGIREIADLRAVRDEVWTLGTLVSVLRKRQVVFLFVLGAFIAGATFYCLLATRRYQATGQIQIQKDDAVAFGLQNSVMGDAPDGASNALDYNISLQTEANILRSDSLALEVIQELHLETSRDFYPSGKSVSRKVLSSWILFWKKPVEPMSVPLDRAPNRRYAVLRIFASHLKVEPVTGTRLIDISYTNPDPELAAAVVNHLIGALVQYTFRARFHATADASNWLSAQLGDLRKQTESLQSKAIALQRDTGMFGDDESHNVMLTRLDSLNEALSAAESNRILKEAVYHVAASGDPELISGLGGNASIGTAAPMANSLGLIQSLRAQESAIRVELDEDRVRYGSAYPRIGELQAELIGIEKSIKDEVRRIGERTHTDYEIAAETEGSARAAFEKQKKLVNDLNDKTTAYHLAKQEADGSREVYEGLLAKLKQAGVLEGLRSTNISVVNPARVPPPNRPKSPNALLYYAAAIGAGLICAVCAALLRDMTDTKLRSLEELEQLTGAPVLGLIPAVGDGIQDRWRLWRFPGSSRASEASLAPQVTISHFMRGPFAESLRALRTSLMLPHSSSAPQVLLITSSHSGEGKSTVSLNLATVLAQQGSRVLLVDADLRRPILHERIGLREQIGLSAALTSKDSYPPHPVEGVPNLYVVCGGDVPEFPTDLLGSHRMRALLAQWRAEYAFIVMDGPPVLPVADAVVLEQLCDAVLLVARHGVTEKKAAHRSYQSITKQLPQGVAIGAVLNAVPERSSAFYEYYGYRNRKPSGERRRNEAHI